ncbi:unnamed protein product [Ceratitis capitata]|uniref:(Mediterranean fruit fly) hypothetical protein n=1 Tax=Ceratitis capitata TaxID=7213 RepID=A0A811UVJ5_CERCA|nr:unnamed protein product [Ceratitis capitata]
MDELDDDDFNETGDELDSEDDIEEANFTDLETSVATDVPGSSKRRRVSSNKRKIDGKRAFVPTSDGFVGQPNEIKNDTPKFKSMT